MAALLDALVLLEAVVHPDAAEEGRRIIIGMLIVGLVFGGIVILGEFVHWYRHDRPYTRRP